MAGECWKANEVTKPIHCARHTFSKPKGTYLTGILIDIDREKHTFCTSRSFHYSNEQLGEAFLCFQKSVVVCWV
jgi:hypothetical protein